MTNQRHVFWIIVALTILSILFLLPKTIPLRFATPKLPLINKAITVNREFIGFDPAAIFAKLGAKQEFGFRRGLDLAGGTSLTLKADMQGIPATQREAALDAAKTVIQRRVDFLGVSEPIIQTAKVNNEYRVIVELPGITDINEAVSRVGTTAKLEFRSVLESASQAAYLQYEETSAIGLTGADLQEAQVGFNQQTGTPVVQFTVASRSQQKFFEQTQKLVNKRMAICLDQACFSAPVVQQAIRDNGQISGNFTTEQAKYLASQLNAGALPVSLTIIQQNTIGATLGEKSLQKSIFAGFLSFIIIAVFMVVLYGRLGLVASLALVLYTLFLLALFKVSSITPYPVTLTLAGIAGIVLSIGMAVDANILIFERMKEEMRRGKSKDIAMELGFSRAWSSIKDSNISSIITSLILFYFGTGIVRGFAVTLLIGVVVSMFSAITVTRTFLRMMYKK